MDGVQVIPDFLVHSKHADVYLSYYLSFLAHVHDNDDIGTNEAENNDLLSTYPDDDRFVTIRHCSVELHYGTVTSIKYRFEKFERPPTEEPIPQQQQQQQQQCRRYRLPRILHNKSIQ